MEFLRKRPLKILICFKILLSRFAFRNLTSKYYIKFFKHIFQQFAERDALEQRLADAECKLAQAHADNAAAEAEAGALHAEKVIYKINK